MRGSDDRYFLGSEADMLSRAFDWAIAVVCGVLLAWSAVHGWSQ
jgi:hypothetical protein